MKRKRKYFYSFLSFVTFSLTQFLILYSYLLYFFLTLSLPNHYIIPQSLLHSCYFPIFCPSICFVVQSLSFRLGESGFCTITWLSHRSVLKAQLVLAVSWLTAWAWVKLYRSSLSSTSFCATLELTPCSSSSL